MILSSLLNPVQAPAQRFTFLSHTRWDLGLQSPNYAGLLCAIGIAICMALDMALQRNQWLSQELFPLERCVLLSGELSLWLLLAHTYSRGGLIAVFASAALLFLRAVRENGISFFLCKNTGFSSIRIVAVSFLLFRTEFFVRVSPGFLVSDHSVTNRISLWKAAIALLSSIPNFGLGFGRSGAVYAQWFQPLDVQERYKNLVNGFYTFYAEFGPAAFAISIGALLFLCISSDFLTSNKENSNWSAFLSDACAAAIAAFLTANVFSALYEDKAILLILFTATTASVYLVARRGVYVFFKGLCITILVVAVLPITARFFMGNVGYQYSLISRGYVSLESTHSSTDEKYGFWLDPWVLGPEPEREFRLLLPVLKCKSIHVINPWDHQGTLSPPVFTKAFLFGRAAEKLPEILRAGCAKVVLIHPAVPPPPNLINIGELTILLPEVDERNVNDMWITWSREAHAKIVFCASVGMDVRGAWPSIYTDNQ